MKRRRSVRWGLMDKFEIPDFDAPEENYLTRYRLIQTPMFGIYLHRMDHPDSRPTLHDHPWGFISIALWGGYEERRLRKHDMTVNEEHMVRHLNVVRRDDAHAIKRLFRVPSWTLVFVGARRRIWGYWEPNGDSSWKWTPFDTHAHSKTFEDAMAIRGMANIVRKEERLARK